MKKTLIALAVLGVAGVAHAQSNVTIYGELDVGYAKTSQEVAGKNVPLQMVNGVDNRLGFRGVEDLGGGLKATFQLEQRFDLDTGATQDTDLAWKGQANVGLAGAFGAVKLGRDVNPVNEAHRKYDPFNQYGFAYGAWNDTRIDIEKVRQSNALRYDSPNMSGFTVSGIWSAKEANGADTNQGYGAVAAYNNKALSLSAGYDRQANSADSNIWYVGGSYAFGPAKISASYLKGKDKSQADPDEKQVVVGVDYKLGSGTIKAAYDQMTVAAQKDKKFELGYWYGMSKRTTLYGSVAHVSGDFADASQGGNWNGIRAGINHKF